MCRITETNKLVQNTIETLSMIKYLEEKITTKELKNLIYISKVYEKPLSATLDITNDESIKEESGNILEYIINTHRGDIISQVLQNLGLKN